jgi:hypothetical protein
MPIARAQAPVSVSNAANGTSIAVAFGSNVTAGNLLVAFASVDTTNTPSITFSSTGAPTWVTIATFTEAGAAARFAIGYCVNAPGGATTVTATFSQNNSLRSIHIVEYSGAAIAAVLDKNTTGLSTAPVTNPTDTAMITTAAGDLIVSALIYRNATSPATAGAGYSFIGNDSTVSDFAAEDQIQTSAGSIATTFTVTGGSLASGIMSAAFKAATAGPQPSARPGKVWRRKFKHRQVLYQTQPAQISRNLSDTVASVDALTVSATVALTDTVASADALTRTKSPLKNSFEGGSNGTTITTGNSGTAPDDAFDNVSTGTGATTAFDNTQAAHGTLSAKIATAATSTTSYLEWSASFPNPATRWFRAYLYFTALPAAQYRVLNVLQGSTNIGNILFTAAGALAFTRAAGTTVFTSAAIPLNQWVRLEGFVTGDASVGQWEYKIWYTPDSPGTPDDTQTSAATQAMTGVPDKVRFGIGLNIANAGPYWMDDIGLSDTGYLGPISTTPISLADTVGVADSISIAVSAALTDIVSAADSLSVAAAISLTDVASAVDALSVAAAVPLTDTAHASDAISITAAVPLTDTVSIVDLLSVFTGGNPTLTDVVSVADNLSIVVTLALSDTVSINDQLDSGNPLNTVMTVYVLGPDAPFVRTLTQDSNRTHFFTQRAWDALNINSIPRNVVIGTIYDVYVNTLQPPNTYFLGTLRVVS